MRRYFTTLVLIFCCAVFCENLWAQGDVADSVQQRALASNMEIAYNKNVGRQSRLFNGFAYQLFSLNSRGTPYFKDSTNLVVGTVSYDGIVYKNVALLYDIYQNVLVSRLTSNLLLYSLLNEKIDFFDLMGHHFINTQFDVSAKPQPVGFYDELYKNKLQILAKREKTTQNTIANNAPITVFFTDNKYYLKKGGIYYDADSKGKFLAVLQDKKKEIKKFLKDNNISYGDNPEQAMIAIANYYDSLTN